MSTVSLVKSVNPLIGVYDSLLPLKSSIQKAVANIDQILIKVNFVTVHNQLAATSSVAVEGLLKFLRQFYSGHIILAEGATIGTTPQGWQNYDYHRLVDSYRVKLLDLNSDSASPVTLINRFGLKFTLPFSDAVKKSRFVISICPAKTHDTVVVTLSLKNLLVGSLVHRSRIHQGKKIHQNLANLAIDYHPHLSIVDATVGMEGDGPISGTPANAGWVASGLDFLAADTLAASLMGFNLDDIGYLSLCRQSSLGLAYPDNDITIIGPNPDTLTKSFLPHQTFKSQINWQ